MSGIDERPRKKKTDWNFNEIVFNPMKGEFQYDVDTNSIVVRWSGGIYRRVVDGIPANCRRCGASMVLRRQDANSFDNTISLTHECILCGDIIRMTIVGV